MIEIVAKITVLVVESILIGLFISTTYSGIVETANEFIKEGFVPKYIWVMPAIYFGLFWFFHGIINATI